MTRDAERGAGFARVIAALDASCHDVRTLAMAADMAARFGVDVAGLFVEDINLFRLAALPMARHVVIGSMTPAALNPEQLESDMRALAARAATELEACAARYGVRSSFRIVRGLPTAELAAATMAGDLLVLGAVRELTGLPLRLGSPLHQAAYRTGRSVLHARQRALPVRPLVVVRAGSHLAPRALTIATQFADSGSRELSVLMVGPPAETSRAATPLARSLAGRGYRVGIRETGVLNPEQLVRAAREGGHDVLVLTADIPGVRDDGGIEDVVLSAPCDVLVIR